MQVGNEWRQWRAEATVPHKGVISISQARVGGKGDFPSPPLLLLVIDIVIILWLFLRRISIVNILSKTRFGPAGLPPKRETGARNMPHHEVFPTQILSKYDSERKWPAEAVPLVRGPFALRPSLKLDSGISDEPEARLPKFRKSLAIKYPFFYNVSEFYSATAMLTLHLDACFICKLSAAASPR
jgi:hypothetical protein